MKTILIFVNVLGCIIFLMNCGDSGSSSQISQTIQVPGITSLTLLPSDHIDTSGALESGFRYSIHYHTDTAVSENVTDTDIGDSIVMVAYLLHKDSSYQDIDYNSTLGIGSDFYHPHGGEIDVVIPENTDTDEYKIYCALDPQNISIFSDIPKPDTYTDTLTIVDNKDNMVEILYFKAVSNLAVWSDSDYTEYGSPKMFTRVEYFDTILSVVYDTALNDSIIIFDSHVTYETKVVSRPAHIKINADIVLRGEAASTNDTTYVGFYLEGYGTDSDVDILPDTWADLAIIKWVTDTEYQADSLTEEKLIYYYPISHQNDTEPNQPMSITLDLWIPQETANDTVLPLYNKLGKSIWRLVMFVENRSVPMLYKEDLNEAETFRAFDYVRILKIQPDDIYPDGSRAPENNKKKFSPGFVPLSKSSNQKEYSNECKFGYDLNCSTYSKAYDYDTMLNNPYKYIIEAKYNFNLLVNDNTAKNINMLMNCNQLSKDMDGYITEIFNIDNTQVYFGKKKLINSEQRIIFNLFNESLNRTIKYTYNWNISLPSGLHIGITTAFHLFLKTFMIEPYFYYYENQLNDNGYYDFACLHIDFQNSFTSQVYVYSFNKSVEWWGKYVDVITSLKLIEHDMCSKHYLEIKDNELTRKSNYYKKVLQYGYLSEEYTRARGDMKLNMKLGWGSIPIHTVSVTSWNGVKTEIFRQ